MQVLTEIFGLSKPFSEIFIRGTGAYLTLVVLFRLIPKRNAGHISPNDMLVLIVIGTLGADAVTGGTESFGDILLMILLILGWSFVLDLLENRVPGLRRVLRHPQTLLIKDGRLLRANMRREMITEDEIMAVLRRDGLEDPSAIKSATLEADGDISLIRKDDLGPDRAEPRTAGGSRVAPAACRARSPGLEDR